ncbi:MAG TPA: FkbM family methyltransferase [Flavitalea sp.]|nr:FkbM family methyltransferase [Flavitalea sp.]
MDNILRALPSFRGKTRLARLLFDNEIKHQKDVLIKGKYNCSFVIPNLQENVGLDIFINGIYEPETIRFLNRIIPRNGQFLDLGANIGAVLIPLCKRRPDISAVAVEAAPWIFEYLEKNVKMNGLQNVQLLNKALFDKDDVELDFFSPGIKFGKGSLAPVFSQEPVKVMTNRVDTIVRQFQFGKVSTIKLDVEGFEFFVFKGAEHLLQSSDSPDIIFEFVDWAETKAMGLHAGAAQEYLLSVGYQLYLLENDHPVKMEEPLKKGSSNLFATKKDYPVPTS